MAEETATMQWASWPKNVTLTWKERSTERSYLVINKDLLNRNTT